MTLTIKLSDNATNKLTDLYLAQTDTSGLYADTMRADIEEYASRLLSDSLRAKHNYYTEKGLIKPCE